MGCGLPVPVQRNVALNTIYVNSSGTTTGTYGQGLTATLSTVGSGYTFIGSAAPAISTGTASLGGGGMTVITSNGTLSGGAVKQLTLTGGTTNGTLSVIGTAATGTLYAGPQLSGSQVSYGSGAFTIGSGAQQTPSAPVYPQSRKPDERQPIAPGPRQPKIQQDRKGQPQ